MVYNCLNNIISTVLREEGCESFKNITVLFGIFIKNVDDLLYYLEFRSSVILFLYIKRQIEMSKTPEYIGQNFLHDLDRLFSQPKTSLHCPKISV